jgi:hypothetical protein
MSQDDAAKRHSGAKDPVSPPEPLSWLSKFDRGFTLVKGLSVVTVLSSVLVGYFQYLNSYQEKVSAHAKENMLAATKTFEDISTKFSLVQTLQQQLFSDFSTALDDRSDANEQSLATKNAQGILKTYDEAQLTLFETGELLARNAEIYIDWAANFTRDPAQPKTPTSDPLDQSLLRAYDFDCSHYLPRFLPPSSSTSNAGRAPGEGACSADTDKYNRDPDHSYVNVCPKNSEKAGSSESVTIHWFSAKHQVQVMHYCLRALHERLAPVRYWASQSESKPASKASLQPDRDQIQTAIDLQAKRLNAFMSLATFQMDGIRESYRPDSFACHVPILTSVVGLFNDACTPIKTTPIIMIKR